MAKTDHHSSLPRTRWPGRSSGRGRCRAGQNPSDITTSAITERLGLSRGALFRHFPNQDAIVQAVVSWAAGRLMARVTQQYFRAARLAHREQFLVELCLDREPVPGEVALQRLAEHRRAAEPDPRVAPFELGRATWRERGCQY